MISLNAALTLSIDKHHCLEFERNKEHLHVNIFRTVLISKQPYNNSNVFSTFFQASCKNTFLFYNHIIIV